MKNKINTHANNDTTSVVNNQAAGFYDEIKLGIDQHADHLRIVRMIDGSAPQPAIRIKPEQLSEYIQRQFKQSRLVYSCYEAGALSPDRTGLADGAIPAAVQPDPEMETLPVQSARACPAEETGDCGGGPATLGGLVALADRADHTRTTGLDHERLNSFQEQQQHF